ncbi:Ribosomal RNA large subunit methyltransferase M [Thalassocella blandensis]|nr:Ribosomal RNA large subunit methyltransferase M [Thalassocella blandensis]
MEVVCLCRAGFEKEVVAELQEYAAQLQITGYVKAKDKSGYVSYVCASEDQAEKFVSTIPFTQLIFIRHWFVAHSPVMLPDVKDRVTPLSLEAEKFPPFTALQSLLADTNEGKSLAALSKSISRHLTQFLQRKKRLDANADWCAQLLFLDGDKAYFGRCRVDNISPWLGGIPRLRAPKSAPSRATLKLEEAWHHFVPKQEWSSRLAPGLRAVDLGAAPGGWTWQLVQKSMFVDAIDNGPMDEALMESGQVDHHRADGFVFIPKKSVYWLVCDIADKPARVASLVCRWAENRWFEEAIFNLKLPMKQRHAAVMDAAAKIGDVLHGAGIPFELRFKQLYHDREEVTAHLRLY